MNAIIGSPSSDFTCDDFAANAREEKATPIDGDTCDVILR